MLFQTPIFFLFFAIAFAIYWLFGPRYRLQNAFLLVCSYVFYGWWDWKLLGLIAAACTCDFLVTLAINASEHEKVRHRLLLISMLFNLSVLGFFKYYNFFARELETLVRLLGGPIGDLRLDIILPVGVSFYTFQTMSYTIDVYRRRIQPIRDPVAYFAYVAFFPQLVAGPIERASHLLPQFVSVRHFSYATAVHGCRLILWGFFKKLIVADLCGEVVDQVFNDYSTQQGWVMLFACTGFAFQIYGDFSGYSDIARGLALTLGFDLMQNFKFPYFSRDPAEFWRRWHISLSTWFRDYVYLPLGGNRVGNCRRSVNIISVFAISGLWHGANWTFIAWGLLNGLLVLPFVLSQGRSTKKPVHQTGWQSLCELMSITLTFASICTTWILFRSANIGDAWMFTQRMFTECIDHPGGLLVAVRRFILREPSTWAVACLVLAEWYSYRQKFSFESVPRPIRWMLYLIMSSIVAWLAFYRDATEFIYFQF